MTEESIKSFVTYYLQSLKERTRREKGGTKWGIDWVAYNIGLAKFGNPVRLPFLRNGDEGYPKSKVEAEFGIDLAFLSPNGRALTIFVLKDEPLTNTTWTSADFCRDLQMATYPDLGAEGLSNVVSVNIILAYNKDDHRNGIEAYDRFVAGAPRRLRDEVGLSFDRWNLSEFAAQTIQHILSPSLLPERFFGHLSYLSAQVSDFLHGSDAWENQLIPSWKRFIEDILQESGGARGPALIPVVLIILREHGRANPSIETAWIDLVEWAAIALWNAYRIQQDSETREAICRFWSEFYIAELQRFYGTHIDALGTEHSIDQAAQGSYVGSAASSYIAYWHIARLGLLSVEAEESVQTPDAEGEHLRRVVLRKIADWTAAVVRANASALRPVLDIQHIELFLLIEIFRNADRLADLEAIFRALIQRLRLRRLGHGPLPFIDGRNSADNVFEQVGAKPDTPLVQTQSSFLVLMLLEICCIFPVEIRDELICAIHRCLVFGGFDDSSDESSRPLDLMSWIPPRDWARNALRGAREGGQSVAVESLASTRSAEASEIFRALGRLVTESRKIVALELPEGIPLAAVILGCLRHKLPLHPELWRRFAFREPAATVVPAPLSA